MRLKNNSLIFLIIIVAAFAVYGNVIKGDFVSADDYEGIVINQNIKNLPETLKTLYIVPSYFSIIHALFGLKSWAFHVSSILLHIIVSFLVFTFINLIFEKKVAIAATFLFLVHPVGHEAVGWISGVGYLQHAFFVFLTLIPFVKYKKTQEKKYLYFSIFIYIFTLIFYRSPWSLTIPFILFITDQFLIDQKFEINKKKICLYLPFIISSLIFTALFIYKSFFARYQELENMYYADFENATPFLNKLPYVIYMAAKLLIFPKDLTIYQEIIVTPFEYAMMILFTFFYIGLLIKLFKKNKLMFGLFAVIPLSILPAFSPVSIAWMIAERYLYVAIVFFCILLAQLLLFLEKKYRLKNFFVITVFIIFLGYSIRTIARTKDFENNMKLWTATQKVVPQSYRVYNNLGDALASEGDYDNAINAFKMAVYYKPDYAEAVHNIGHTYLVKGDEKMAKKYIQKAYQMNPYLYQSLYVLGSLEFKNGNIDLAKQYFEKALQIKPDHQSSIKAIETLDELIKQQQSQVQDLSE